MDFDLYVSELVLTEARAGDAQLASKRLDLLEGIPLLPVSGEILELAGELIAEGALPWNAARDATHVAIATACGCDYLLTWNCRHIANAELRGIIHRVIDRHGYDMPNLCTPEELMGEEGEECDVER